jgi:hypothetical protein
MEKKKLLLTTTLLSILAGSVFAASSVKASAKDKNLQSSVNDNWAVLGAPTLYATGMPTSALICMNTESSVIGTSPQAGFNFSSQASNSAISASLNLGTGMESFVLYSFNASANASFVASTRNSEYTLNFVYLYTYSTDAKLNPSEVNGSFLSPVGQKLLNRGQATFFTSCGDSFVSGLKAGVVLAVNVGVNFKSKLDTLKFQETGSLSGASLPTIIQSIEANLENQGSTATISVSALQNGGTPENLQNIFINPQTGNSTMFCSSESPTSCEAIIDGVNRYASTLPSQVKNANGMIYNNLYFFSPVINTYYSLGIESIPDQEPLSKPVKDAQNAVLEQLTIEKNRIAFLSTYKQNSLPIMNDLSKFITAQTTNLNNRIKYIQAQAADCFNASAYTCPTIVEGITNTFKTSTNIYSFDKIRYNKLKDESWYYIKDSTSHYLVPASLGETYATYIADLKGNLNKTNKTAQVFTSTENGVEYVSQFVIPNPGWIDTTFKCLPAANDSKFSSTRNFACKTDNVLVKNFDVQFVKTANPI